MLKVSDLRTGDKVSYSFFVGVTFQGLSPNGKEVNLIDKNGNEKLVYRDLFEKYASKVTD